MSVINPINGNATTSTPANTGNDSNITAGCTPTTFISIPTPHRKKYHTPFVM